MANSSKGSATTGGLKYSKAAAGVGQGSKDSWAPPSPGLAHLSAEAAAQRLAFVYASLVVRLFPILLWYCICLNIKMPQGSKVSVTLKNQSVFEGIFHAASGASLFWTCLICCCTHLRY